LVGQVGLVRLVRRDLLGFLVISSTNRTRSLADTVALVIDKKQINELTRLVVQPSFHLFTFSSLKGAAI